MYIFLRERHNVQELTALYIDSIVNKLFGYLLLRNPDLKYVKIWILFYDNDNKVI
jgi:hypothetical protein